MKRVRIGLVGVRKLAGCQILEETNGAFVNVLTVALSVEEFEMKVQHCATELLLFFDEIEDAELFEARIVKHEVAEKLKDLSDQPEHHPSGAFFGTFHTHLGDDT